MTFDHHNTVVTKNDLSQQFPAEPLLPTTDEKIMQNSITLLSAPTSALTLLTPNVTYVYNCHLFDIKYHFYCSNIYCTEIAVLCVFKYFFLDNK